MNGTGAPCSPQRTWVENEIFRLLLSNCQPEASWIRSTDRNGRGEQEVACSRAIIPTEAKGRLEWGTQHPRGVTVVENSPFPSSPIATHSAATSPIFSPNAAGTISQARSVCGKASRSIVLRMGASKCSPMRQANPPSTMRCGFSTSISMASAWPNRVPGAAQNAKRHRIPRLRRPAHVARRQPTLRHLRVQHAASGRAFPPAPTCARRVAQCRRRWPSLR